MKPGIHPNWYPDAVVTCACGNSWTTGSTKKEFHTDVCNKCHPFFTGEQRIVDTAGQVERFMKRVSAKEQIAATQPAPEDKQAKKEKRRDRKPGTTVILSKTPEAPAELPLAVVEEKPVAALAPAMPIVESPKPAEPKPVVQVEEPQPVVIRLEEPKPVVVESPRFETKVETPAPVQAIARVAEPVVAPVAEEKKTKPRAAKASVKKTVKASVAKKPAAKKPAAKTAKPKTAAKPKPAAKKPAPAKKTSPAKKAKK